MQWSALEFWTIVILTDMMAFLKDSRVRVAGYFLTQNIPFSGSSRENELIAGRLVFTEILTTPTIMATILLENEFSLLYFARDGSKSNKFGTILENRIIIGKESY